MIKIFILNILFRISFGFGGAMFKKLINWLYPENRISDDIVISIRNIRYSNVKNPIIDTYLDIQNKTLYPSIDLFPSSFDINQSVICQSEFTTITREKTGIRFMSIINKSQENILLEFKKQQENFKGQGILKINGYLIFFCNNRRIRKVIHFEGVNLEGI